MSSSIIDVIIPVFNGERFIDSIFNTLEAQTFEGFRAVFVDDGSIDNSFAYISEKANDCSFETIVIHKENGGLSSARNAGIMASDAKWLTFVDCDDKLDAHFFEYLHRAVTESGTKAGYCGYQGIPYENQEKIKPVGVYNCDVITAEECMKLYYTNWVGAWGFIIDREWLIANDLLFDEKCTYCEDIPFITKLIESTDKISKLNNDLYLYLHRQGSLIRSPKMEKYIIGIDAFLRMAEVIENKNSAAARVFADMGKVRYMLATLRKGAVQLPFKSFIKLTSFIDRKTIKNKIRNLSNSQRIAGYIYLLSKTLFYYCIRLLFKD